MSPGRNKGQPTFHTHPNLNFNLHSAAGVQCRRPKLLQDGLSGLNPDLRPCYSQASSATNRLNKLHLPSWTQRGPHSWGSLRPSQFDSKFINWLVGMLYFVTFYLSGNTKVEKAQCCSYQPFGKWWDAHSLKPVTQKHEKSAPGYDKRHHRNQIV